MEKPKGEIKSDRQNEIKNLRQDVNELREMFKSAYSPKKSKQSQTPPEKDNQEIEKGINQIISNYENEKKSNIALKSEFQKEKEQYIFQIESLKRENAELNKKINKLKQKNDQLSEEKTAATALYTLELQKLTENNQQLTEENNKLKLKIDELYENDQRLRQKVIETLTPLNDKLEKLSIENEEIVNERNQFEKDALSNKEKLEISRKEFHKYQEIYETMFQQIFEAAMKNMDNKEYSKRKYNNFKSKKSIILNALDKYGTLKEMSHKTKDLLFNNKSSDKKVAKLKELYSCV